MAKRQPSGVRVLLPWPGKGAATASTRGSGVKTICTCGTLIW
jgi:hypothetical protein